MKKKSVFQTALVLALVALLMTACGGGGGPNTGPGTGNLDPPKATDLPDFPEGSTPAKSAEEAQNILEAIGVTSVFDKYEADVTNAWSHAEYSGSEGNTSAEGTGDFVTISGENTSKDGVPGWVQYLEGEEEPSGPITIRSGDKFSQKTTDDTTTTVTNDIVDGDVTIVAGSETKTSSLMDMVAEITTGHTIASEEDFFMAMGTMKANGSYKYNYSEATGITIKTSTGAVKVIIQRTDTASDSMTGLGFEDIMEMKDSYIPPEPTCKGSFVVYGAENTELLSETFTSREEYEALKAQLGLSGGY